VIVLPTPSPTTVLSTPSPTVGSCSSISTTGQCNKEQGCGWNVDAKECLDALSTFDCSQFNNKMLNCKNNGCKFENGRIIAIRRRI